MHSAIIAQFSKTLGNLDGILGKAAEQATARGYNVDNFMQIRLAPDMLPFWRQVTIACDGAKGTAALVSGTEAPKFEDNEQTVADLRARIAKTRAYLDSKTVAELDAVPSDALVKVAYPPNKKMVAKEAVLMRQVPNFFFHVTTAYAILRAGGIVIGKSDYLGELNMFDA